MARFPPAGRGRQRRLGDGTPHLPALPKRVPARSSIRGWQPLCVPRLSRASKGIDNMPADMPHNAARLGHYIAGVAAVTLPHLPGFWLLSGALLLAGILLRSGLHHPGEECAELLKPRPQFHVSPISIIPGSHPKSRLGWGTTVSTDNPEMALLLPRQALSAGVHHTLRA